MFVFHCGSATLAQRGRRAHVRRLGLAFHRDGTENLSLRDATFSLRSVWAAPFEARRTTASCVLQTSVTTARTSTRNCPNGFRNFLSPICPAYPRKRYVLWSWRAKIAPTCFSVLFTLSPPSSIGQAVSKSRDFLRRMAQPYKAVPGVSLLSLEHVRTTSSRRPGPFSLAFFVPPPSRLTPCNFRLCISAQAGPWQRTQRQNFHGHERHDAARWD